MGRVTCRFLTYQNVEGGFEVCEKNDERPKKNLKKKVSQDREKKKAAPEEETGSDTSPYLASCEKLAAWAHFDLPCERNGFIEYRVDGFRCGV